MSFIQKYYACSSPAFGRACACIALFTLLGCAGPNQAAQGAPRFAFTDLNGAQRRAGFSSLAKGLAVVHFKRGDRVPLRFVLDSSLADLRAPELELVVERDFYVLISPDGPPRLSEDGVDFESKAKNYFVYGFNVPKAGDASMVVRIGLRP